MDALSAQQKTDVNASPGLARVSEEFPLQMQSSIGGADSSSGNGLNPASVSGAKPGEVSNLQVRALP